MSFREKKRDRELQIELMKIRVYHSRKASFFSTLASIGISFAVVSVTMLITLKLAFFEFERTFPMGFNWILLPMFFASLVVLIIYMIWYFSDKSFEEDVEAIKEKYLKW